MKNILERIAEGEILVADGAMGSMLFDRGLKPGESPELLSIENPEVIKEIALLYKEAGADIIQTNTFGGSPLKLAGYGLDKRAAELNTAAVKTLREAVGSDIIISGSCGPTGSMLKPLGDVSEEEMYQNFKVQVSALISAGADVICVETMTDITEACLAVNAAKDFSPATPVMATMTFDKGPRGYYTIMGVDIEAASFKLAEVGTDIIGTNCGNGFDRMIEITKEFKKTSDKPLLIQSNAGMPENKFDKVVYPETPDYFADKTIELIEAGANIIGGCCGTTPAHIRAIRNVVDKYLQDRI